MKKWIIVLFFVPLFASAQKMHTVAPKETLYSVARQYNIHPKDLAAYNNISVETGLTIGQVIKIPAKGTQPPLTSQPPVKKEPVTKNPNAANESMGGPVYHKVEKKETLYHISKTYHITIDDIKRWNNLAGDAVTEGTDLIVGYQKGKKAEAVITSKPAKETETKTVSTPQVIQLPPEEKPVIVQKEIAVDSRPVLPSGTQPSKQEANKVTGKSVNGGYFKNMYNEAGKKEETGTAAVFKSTSGWEDGKYYCLHNTATAGSVIKITNKNNQKYIYAKVLDVIPDLKQNAGILVRLSNAAADELGAGENNFEAVLNY